MPIMSPWVRRRRAATSAKSASRARSTWFRTATSCTSSSTSDYCDSLTTLKSLKTLRSLKIMQSGYGIMLRIQTIFLPQYFVFQFSLIIFVTINECTRRASFV